MSHREYVKELLSIRKAENTYLLIEKTQFDLFTETYNLYNFDVEKQDWLAYFFQKQNIHPAEFLAWLEIIKTKRYKKINALVLEGPTNSGKSLLMDTLIKPFNPELIARENDKSSFHLDQLPIATCALFEEPMITPTNVGTWKLLLEGSTIKTDIKHNNKQEIHRLPIYITTATPLTNNIDVKEKEQIMQRIKLYKLPCSIKHRNDEYTQLNAFNCEIINTAPAVITLQDLSIFL